jgi:hypothetical protein
MGGGTKDQAITVASDNSLANIHLRHSTLASMHSHLKNYMMCMDRNYFGTNNTPEEIELVKNLHTTLEHIEAVMCKYYNQEAAILDS